MSLGELQALSNLLGGSLQDENSHLELDDGAPAAGSSMTPGSIGSAVPKKAAAIAKPSKEIWDVDEVVEDVLQSPRRRSQRHSPALPAQHIKDRGVEDDPRPEPEYEVLYKQAVSSEDMYLGMSGRDPSTHWCDDMIVRIKLPEQKLADCDLDVTAKFLDLRTPKFRLGLHLQHPCDPDAGNAKFDSSKGELTVTLKMNRELDYLKN